MKALMTLCLALFATCAWSAEPSSVLKGEVMEVKEVASYTYLRLKTRNGETWAAVSRAPVKVGAEVAVENPMVMRNFESKSLKRTFPEIVFGNLSGSAGSAMSSPEMAMAHGRPSQEEPVIKVPKASGANAYTVAEILSKRTELKDKPVLVRAKVVKFNPEIMGKNWLHIRDGSGEAAKGTHDLLVTSQGQAKVGDVVTVKGVVRNDKDFGAGYAYKVLIEDASLQP